MSEQNIKDLIDENKEPFDFKIQTYLERGFEICNRFAVGFIGFYFLFFLIVATVGNFGAAGEVVNRIFITPILFVGPYFVAHQISQNQSFNFDQFWLGLKEFFPLAMMAAIQGGVYLLILAPFLFSEQGEQVNKWMREWQADPTGMTAFPEVSAVYALLLIPIFFFAVSWSYSSFFIIFRNLSPLESMSASLKMVSRKWMVIALFLLINGVIMFSGLLFFGIGVLYTFPISSCILYASWADWMNHYEKEEEEDRMKDFMDAF